MRHLLNSVKTFKEMHVFSTQARILHLIFQLKTPASLNKTVNTITLPKTENREISKDCMVLGWGLEEYGHGFPSRVLKEANVTLLDSKKCVTTDTLCSEGTTGAAEVFQVAPLTNTYLWCSVGAFWIY